MRFGVEEAELACSEFEECESEAVGAFVAVAEPAWLVQVADRAFYDPALVAESGAVLGATPGDHGDDPASA